MPTGRQLTNTRRAPSRKVSAAMLAATLALPPIPASLPASLPLKPSGKNRDKVKAARKQRQRAKR